MKIWLVKRILLSPTSPTYAVEMSNYLKEILISFPRLPTVDIFNISNTKNTHVGILICLNDDMIFRILLKCSRCPRKRHLGKGPFN